MDPFTWIKVFDFSWNTIKKILSLVFKILIIVGIPALVLWGCFVLFVKPHTNPTPTTTQNVESGGTAVTYTYDIKVGFGGCARIPTQPQVIPKTPEKAAIVAKEVKDKAVIVSKEVKDKAAIVAKEVKKQGG